MNVLLINAYNRISEFLDTEAKMYLKKIFLAPSLGLYRIASYLKSNHNVVVYDPNIEGNPYEYLESVAEEFDIIGFSPTHATLEYDISLMWFARKVNNDCTIVAGGGEATFNANLLEMYSPVDIIVMGEGEKAMKAICENKISGCGRRLQMPLNEEFKEITLGLDFASVPYEKYWDFLERRNKDFEETRTVRIFTSNYCPYGCLFCSATNFLNYAYNNQPNFVSMEAEDLLTLTRKIIETHSGVRTIFFQDDNFILEGTKGQKRVFEFCKGVLRDRARGTIPDTVSFMCETRVDNISKPILECMADAGFRLVFYGVESFSQNILDEFKKGIKRAQIEEALEWTYKVGMTPYITIILTSPNCKLDDIKTTIAGCRKHLTKGVLLGLNLYVIPLPGSEIASLAWDCIECRRVKIPGTSILFNKAERLVPRDKRVRKVLELTNEYLRALNLGERGRFVSHSKSILDLEAVTNALKMEGGL